MSRKYRQSGYQDSESEERPKRKKAPRRPVDTREKPLRPRGRGLGRPTTTVFRCAVCGNRQTADISPGTVCQKCDAELHTCTHCTHFDTSAPGECRKGAPYVSSKAKRNECESFEPKAAQEFAKDAEVSVSKGKAAFDALFKL